jgi:nitrite reductase (NADH) large subunit
MDRQAGEMLRAVLEQRGLKFKMAARTQRLISDGSDHIKAVRFEDGSELSGHGAAEYVT